MERFLLLPLLPRTVSPLPMSKKWPTGRFTNRPFLMRREREEKGRKYRGGGAEEIVMHRNIGSLTVHLKKLLDPSLELVYDFCEETLPRKICI